MGQPFKPYEGNDPYIFISYARKDEARVLPILETLDRAGYRIWYDAGIHAGSLWTEVLIERVEECAVFLAFFSPAFNASEFCFEETDHAYRERKAIVPVHLDPMGKGDLRPLFRLLGSRQGLRRHLFDSDAAFVERLGEEPVFAPCKAAPRIPADAWNKDDTIQWYLDGDGVLTIAKNEDLSSDGSVPMPDYTFNWERGSTAPWIPSREKIRSVVIRDDIDTIGRYAFWDCAGLTSVTISDSVTSIGWGAFSGCAGLTSVTIPDSVTSIGVAAFYDCAGLTSVTIPAGAKLGDNAFPKRVRIIRRPPL